MENWPRFKRKKEGKKVVGETNIQFGNIKKVEQKIIFDFMDYCGKDSRSNEKLVMVQTAIFLGKSLSRITQKDIEKIRDALRNSELKNNSKNDITAVIKRFIKWKYKKNWFTDFDLKILKAENPNIIKNKAGEYQAKITSDMLLTDEEVTRLLNITTNLKYKTIIAVLYESAGRPEELLKLRWRDINFDEGTLSLFSAKTKRSRKIHIYNSLSHLKRWKKEFPFGDFNSDDYVFPNAKDKNKKIDEVVLSITIKNLGKKAELNKNIYPYLFRHTRLTQLIKKNLTDSAYENFAGHSKAMGNKTYSHLSADDFKQEMYEKVFEIEDIKPTETQKLKNQINEQGKDIEGLKEMVLELAGRHIKLATKHKESYFEETPMSKMNKVLKAKGWPEEPVWKFKNKN